MLSTKKMLKTIQDTTTRWRSMAANEGEPILGVSTQKILDFQLGHREAGGCGCDLCEIYETMRFVELLAGALRRELHNRLKAQEGQHGG